MLFVSMMALLLWAAGTAAIRAAGRRLPRPQDRFRCLMLFAASFLVMAVIVPGILVIASVPKPEWFAAVTVLMLPTLALDALSCLYFERVFPNSDSKAAGVFGGWMLIACAGAVVGVWVAR